MAAIDETLLSARGSVPRRKAAVLAAIAGSVVAAGVLFVWVQISERAHEHARDSAELTAEIAGSMLGRQIDGDFRALQQLAGASVFGQPEWQRQARRVLDSTVGFEDVAIVRRDAAGVWRFVSRARSSGVRHVFDPNRLGRLAGETISTGISRIEGPVRSAEAQHILFVVPLPEGTEGESILIAFAQLDTWLSAVVDDLHVTEQAIEIRLADEVVFERTVPGRSSDGGQTAISVVNRTGTSWTTTVTPAEHLLSAGHADTSFLVLAAGLLLSSLVAIVVYFAMGAREHARSIRAVAVYLDALFQSLPGMAYHRDLASGSPLKFVSEGCKALAGYSREDFLMGRVIWDELIEPDDREVRKRALTASVETTETFECEYRITDRSGIERWVWERGTFVSAEDGREAALEGFISDVSRRKHAESELIDATMYSEAVVETAADAVISITNDGRIDGFNPAAERMFEYSAAEIKDQLIDCLMPEPFRSQHGGYIRDYERIGEASIIGITRDVFAVRKDGSEFPISLSVSEISAGGQRRFVGFIRDLSKQRAAEREAREHREHLAHVDRLNMLGEMATGIAHEINQPLTAISLFAQAGPRLLESGRLEQLAEIFEKLLTHAHRASDVVERMQTMARQRDSEKEIVDCEGLVRETVSLAEAEGRLRGVGINVEVDQALPRVRVDVIQIQQVILNLLRNAMEQTAGVDGRSSDEISIRATVGNDGCINIQVIDQAGGVRESVADSIFAPFTTTKKSGMGMGLSISQAIVVAHGGHLSFQNNECGGATFNFSLPSEEASERE